MNIKIKSQFMSFCILASLLLSIVFKVLIHFLHIEENNFVAINVLQVLYRILIIGLPLLLITIVKDNENYILSVANKDDSKYGWKDYFYVKKLSFSYIWRGIVISIFTIILCYLVKSSLYNLYYGITGKVTIAGENLLNKIAMDININSVIIALISLILIPAILEEILFRGSIYNSFQNNNVLFIVFSTVTFALLHQDILQLPFVLTIGIICSLVMIRVQNTSVTILIHMISNAFVVFVLDRIKLPLDLSKTILHEDHTLALFYALIGFGLSIFFLICIIVLVPVLFKKQDKEKNTDKKHSDIKIKEKFFSFFVMLIFILIFVAEVV